MSAAFGPPGRVRWPLTLAQFQALRTGLLTPSTNVSRTEPSRVDVVFSHSRRGASIKIDRHSLLPIDLNRFARPVQNHTPLTTLAPWALLERLASEYIYAQLCEAATHAFTAENEARMMAMASAKTNIETSLARLLQRGHQLRQEEITTEIVELAAGAEALTGRY